VRSRSPTLLRESRAILLDLDDTLYPHRAFVLSGFRRVAERLARERGLPLRTVLRVLRRAYTNGEGGNELHVLCARFGLPSSIEPWLVAVMRDHAPSLRLPRESASVLTALRASWKIGLLTTGAPEIQRRKIAALGLGNLVDAVVFAADYGDGGRQPGSEAFHAALDQLNATPETAVFVGDDPATDIAGASAVGLRTIHVITHWPMDRDCGAAGCGIHVEQFELVPAIANQLVPIRTRYQVA
jgi:putative hydrolase of the HAD superfamily